MKHAKRRVGTAAGLIALAAGLAAPPAQAATRQWNVGSGLWSTPGNWSPAIVPGPADFALVNHFSNGNGGVARINTTAIGAVTSATVTNSNTIQISNQGSLLVGTDLVVGQLSTPGTLNIQTIDPTVSFPGGLTVVGNLRLGVLSGSGVVNHNAGTVTVGVDVHLPTSRDQSSLFTPSGIYNLSGTGVLRAQRVSLGDIFSPGAGTFNLSGFATANLDYLSVSGSIATGAINQTGGQMSVSQSLSLWATSGTSVPRAIYNLSGGTLNSVKTYLSNSSTLNYSGGTALLGDLEIFDGRIILSPGGNKVLRADSLYLVYDEGVIDLSDNRMILANSGAVFLHRELQQGYNGGAWTGKGITSSAAAAVAASGSAQRTSLGWRYIAGEWVVRYTYAGDATLDGVVNLQDFNRLAANFGRSFQYWDDGDFNYDGVVNLADFNILAANFGLSASGPDVTPQDWSNLAAAVPEPGSLLLVVLGGVAAARRRRG